MNKKPLVSVLMPAYNAEKYISESIESILNQSFKNFELLIVDDASTDSTLRIAKRFEKIDQRIQVFANKKNLNIAANRNFLLTRSNGDFIAWQDADDISVPQRLEWQVEYLNRHPKVGIVGGYLEIFDLNENKSIRKYDEDDLNLRKKIFRYSPVAQPAAMIRKEILSEVGEYGLNLSPAEDIDMSFRIGTISKFANIQKVVLQYRNYPDSSTYKKLRKIEIITIITRWKYVLNRKYPATVVDLLYNFLQIISIFLIPARIKIKLFNKLRNS